MNVRRNQLTEQGQCAQPEPLTEQNPCAGPESLTERDKLAQRNQFPPRVPFSVQWHLTTSCTNQCRHCYMTEPGTYQREKAAELNLQQLTLVLGDIEQFAAEHNLHLCYAFSGGDPLLKEGFFDFLSEVRRYNRPFVILGNPETLTRENVELLRSFGMLQFQLSLDGLENTHDWVRGKGSFARTIEAIELLSQMGVPVAIMFTVYPYNVKELLPVMELVAIKNVRSFAFDIGTYIGSAKQLNPTEIDAPAGITRLQMRDICHQYLKEKERLKLAGFKTHFTEKNHLLKLARLERGELSTVEKPHYECFGGCLIGWNSVCILANGDVLGCRRIPEVLGNLPGQTFADVWLHSQTLRLFRRRESWSECGKCQLYGWCRGCPAVTFSSEGDYFQKNPLCWRDTSSPAHDSNGLAPEKSCQSHAPWPLDGDDTTELAGLKRHINYANQFSYLNGNRTFKMVYMDLLLNPEKLQAFLANPYAALQKNPPMLGLSVQDNLSQEIIELLYWLVVTH